MNVTWYVGTNSSNVNTLLGTDNNIGNGTIYKQYIQATTNYTTYYWRINATDENNTVEYIYQFTTARTLPTIITTGGGGINPMVFAIIGILGIFGIFGFMKKKRRPPPEQIVYRRRQY